MTGVARGLAGLGALSMWRIVYGRLWPMPSLWMSFSTFASVRLGALYHVLSDTRSGYAEQHPLARRERDPYLIGVADL